MAVSIKNNGIGVEHIEHARQVDSFAANSSLNILGTHQSFPMSHLFIEVQGMIRHTVYRHGDQKGMSVKEFVMWAFNDSTT